MSLPFSSFNKFWSCLYLAASSNLSQILGIPSTPRFRKYSCDLAFLIKLARFVNHGSWYFCLCLIGFFIYHHWWRIFNLVGWLFRVCLRSSLWDLSFGFLIYGRLDRSSCGILNIRASFRNLISLKTVDAFCTRIFIF